MDNSWAGPTPAPFRPQIFVYPPRRLRGSASAWACKKLERGADQQKPIRLTHSLSDSFPLSFSSVQAGQQAKSKRARSWRDAGDAKQPPIGAAAEQEEEEARDGGSRRRQHGAGGARRSQRRRGDGVRAPPAPPRAGRAPVHLHPRQAHQGARPPRVGAGAELRPAAAVQAVRQKLRRARGPARGRQPARRQRQDRPAGDNQHRAPRAARRRPAHTRRQVRRRGPPPPELLIHHNCPPGEH